MFTIKFTLNFFLPPFCSALLPVILSYSLCKDCISTFHCFGVIFSPKWIEDSFFPIRFCKRSRISGYLARLSKLSIFLVVINFSALSADCKAVLSDIFLKCFPLTIGRSSLPLLVPTSYCAWWFPDWYFPSRSVYPCALKHWQLHRYGLLALGQSPTP